MEGSWLSHALPQLSSNSLSPGVESRGHAKAPRWRTKSPMAAPTIPPPIVSSVYFPTSSGPSDKSSSDASTDDELLLFRKRQRQLEAHLQLLLDAQADGLLAGLDPSTDNTTHDDGNSTGSSTPTAFNNTNTPSKSPGKVALRDARFGLYNAIRRLAQLKAQESQYLQPNIDHVTSVLSQLDKWQKKRHALQTRTSQIHSGTEQKRAYDLHRQADDMQKEINDLEAKLAKAKADQRRLRAQAQEIENTVEARLSSYNSSLTLLDQDVQAFLYDDSPDHWHAVINTSDMNHFRQLPHESRTLDAASHLFTRERESLLAKDAVNNKERDALEQGALVWKDTVKLVLTFEKKLARATSGLSNQNPEADLQLNNPPATTQELLALLEEITIKLEDKHKHAETRDWKLLVCAIGAELEACLKGKQILEAALATTNSETDSADADGRTSNSAHLDGVSTPRAGTQDEGEAIRKLDDAFAVKNKAKSVSDTDTEDDGPDPELLISHHDTDDTD